jgi:hypothetical protein
MGKMSSSFLYAMQSSPIEHQLERFRLRCDDCGNNGSSIRAPELQKMEAKGS